jgi:hypothetical protein
MTRTLWCACGLALALAAPTAAGAGEVHLSITNGRVALVARDATLREILIEWERVGGTRIVNRDRVPGTRLNLELANVTEEQALTTLLRPIAGYMASRRTGLEGGSSAFSRIILMPGEASAYPAATSAPAVATAPTVGPSGFGGPPPGRPGMQRRVMPDGRVVTIMDDASRAGEQDDPDEAAPGNPPGMMRQSFPGPQRMQQSQAGEAPQADAQPGQAAPGSMAAPGVPATISVPGVMPTGRPGATPPAAPPKPPGD